jgi:hypothetical protein
MHHTGLTTQNLVLSSARLRCMQFLDIDWRGNDVVATIRVLHQSCAGATVRDMYLDGERCATNACFFVLCSSAELPTAAYSAQHLLLYTCQLTRALPRVRSMACASRGWATLQCDDATGITTVGDDYVAVCSPSAPAELMRGWGAVHLHDAAVLGLRRSRSIVCGLRHIKSTWSRSRSSGGATTTPVWHRTRHAAAEARTQSCRRQLRPRKQAAGVMEASELASWRWRTTPPRRARRAAPAGCRAAATQLARIYM